GRFRGREPRRRARGRSHRPDPYHLAAGRGAGDGGGGFARAPAARRRASPEGRVGRTRSQAAALARLLGDHGGGGPDPGASRGLLPLLGARLAGDGSTRDLHPRTVAERGTFLPMALFA